MLRNLKRNLMIDYTDIRCEEREKEREREGEGKR